MIYLRTKFIKLPNLNKKNSHKKIKNNNNSAYVDGFFSYLTSSQLLHEKRFLFTELDFYGSFIGLKQNFYYNIFDDFRLSKGIHPFFIKILINFI